MVKRLGIIYCTRGCLDLETMNAKTTLVAAQRQAPNSGPPRVPVVGHPSAPRTYLREYCVYILYLHKSTTVHFVLAAYGQVANTPPPSHAKQHVISNFKRRHRRIFGSITLQQPGTWRGGEGGGRGLAVGSWRPTSRRSPAGGASGGAGMGGGRAVGTRAGGPRVPSSRGGGGVLAGGEGGGVKWGGAAKALSCGCAAPSHIRSTIDCSESDGWRHHHHHRMLRVRRLARAVSAARGVRAAGGFPGGKGGRLRRRVETLEEGGWGSWGRTEEQRGVELIDLCLKSRRS